MPRNSVRNLLVLSLFLSLNVFSADYYVDNQAKNASDENPGSISKPWKTLQRAGGASELKAGDTVYIKGGVYRETLKVTVGGMENNPITFRNAPGERVVVKGSELYTGEWEKVAGKGFGNEPYPQAFARLWKTKVDESFLKCKEKNGVKKYNIGVLIQLNNTPYRRIGDFEVNDTPYLKKMAIGQDEKDLFPDTFYFKADTREMFIYVSGQPSWYPWELTVRGTLDVRSVKNVVVKGINFQHGGGGVNYSENVLVEDCQFFIASFASFKFNESSNCLARRCDFSWGGNSGPGFRLCRDCAIEDSSIFFCNWRRYHGGWHAGGSKSVKSDRCAFRRCEVAYNWGAGIWFDIWNTETIITDNVIHHNDCAIFYEISPMGAIIAGNFIYSNRGRALYISGSSNVLVCHNTMINNESGVSSMNRGHRPSGDNRIFNNLFIGNCLPVSKNAGKSYNGLDLRISTACKNPTYSISDLRSQSDHNFLSDTIIKNPGFYINWHDNFPLDVWRKKFGFDKNSVLGPADFRTSGWGIEVLEAEVLEEKLDFARPIDYGVYKWRPKNPDLVGCGRYSWGTRKASER